MDIFISPHLLEEGLVFWNGEIDGEEAWVQGGAEDVAIHEGYLCAHWLVLQEMFLWWDHVC